MILHLITQTCFWPHEAYITRGRGGNQGNVNKYVYNYYTHTIHCGYIQINMCVRQEKNAMWENGKTDRECWGR